MPYNQYNNQHITYANLNSSHRQMVNTRRPSFNNSYNFKILNSYNFSKKALSTPQREVETLTFRIQTPGLEGTAMKFKKIKKNETLSADIPIFLKNFRLLATTNEWCNEQGLKALQIIVDAELHYLIEGIVDIEKALTEITRHFFDI